jgi:transposase
MIYNCVEFAAREALVELRSDIEANGGGFEKLLSHWQEEIVRIHFHDRLQQGTNFAEFLKDVTIFIPGKIDWKTAKRELPFSGNIDHEELFRFVKRIKYRWKPPKWAVGGADLQIVRKMRNDLAHGHESFEAIGSQFSTQDVVDKFERVRDFMLSFLRMLERYRAKRLYLQ